MILYQTNDEGFWTGETVEPRRSPRDPNSFLIPRGCVQTPPPALEEGQIARWDWGSETWQVISPEPDLPSAPTAGDYRLAVTLRLDEIARQRGYDNAVTCASYANSTNQLWADESAVFIAHRVEIWTKAYSELAKVESGEIPRPTVEEFMAKLPLFTWAA